MIHIYAGKTAEMVLSRKAVRLDIKKPYYWDSGHAMPIYNDIQLLLLDPPSRRLVVEGFKALIDHHDLKFHVLIGASASSVPYSAMMADLLETPLVCPRIEKPAKKIISGSETTSAWKAVKNKQVLLIQDIVTTGEQTAEVVEHIRKAGGKVQACLNIFNYCFPQAEELFSSLDPALDCYTILKYEVFLEAAIDRGYIKENQHNTLLEWKEDPFQWGEKHGFNKLTMGK